MSDWIRGFFPWHTPECWLEPKGTHWYDNVPQRTYWCHTHNQWASELPTKHTFTWGDGSTTERIKKDG